MMKITKESQMEEKIINEESKMKRITIILPLQNYCMINTESQAKQIFIVRNAYDKFGLHLCSCEHHNTTSMGCLIF